MGRSPLLASLRQQTARVPRWVAVVALLGVAGVADHLTGPFVSVSALYVLPIAVAAWFYGWRAGVLVSVSACILNLAAEWVRLTALGILPAVLVYNYIQRLALFAGLGVLTHAVAEQQRKLQRQGAELAARNEQLQADMNAARTIQELLLPAPVSVDRVDLAVLFRPALTLGGDALDVWVTPEGLIGILVADVSGKGSSAALAGAVLLGMLDRVHAAEHPPGETLESLNRRLTERLPAGMFVTAFYALLDPATGDLTYANAGHEPPLIFRSGEALELRPTGMLLGIEADAAFSEDRVRLAPGELLLAYTDGVSELHLRSGGRLGPERLKLLAEGWQNRPCRQLLDGLFGSLEKAALDADDLEDDITMVAVRLGEAER